MPAGKVPVQESVGGALRFARHNLRFIAVIAAIFAVTTTAVSALALAAPQAGVLTLVANGVIQAICYGALIVGVLRAPEAARANVIETGWRVWASMMVVGFFMTIVMIVITIPVSIILVAGPLAGYAADLQAAGSDQQRVMEVMQRFMEANPVSVLVVMLFYGVIWLLLTSRLYLAAPASVDAGRILTFETWKWTRGATFSIAQARLMLLIPAYILMFTLSILLGRIFGFNMLDGASLQAAASANPGGLIVFELLSSFLVLALYASLEAALSVHLYRGLKPQETPTSRPPVQ